MLLTIIRVISFLLTLRLRQTIIKLKLLVITLLPNRFEKMPRRFSRIGIEYLGKNREINTIIVEFQLLPYNQQSFIHKCKEYFDFWYVLYFLLFND